MNEFFARRNPEAARARLREGLEDRDHWPLITPLVHDAISASIAEKEGFDAVMVGGYGMSVTRLGLPDVGFLGLSDIVPVVAAISQRTGVSTLVDCDTGFGNAINVMHAVEQVLAMGGSAIVLEDQVSPKRCGHVAGKQVVTPEEFELKISAAVRVRDATDPRALIVARCDARGVVGGSIGDVIERGRRYAAAGADVVFPEGIFEVSELEECGQRIPVPLLYNMTGDSPILDEERLRGIGVFDVIAGSAYRPAFKAIQDHFRALRLDGLGVIADAPKPPFLHEITGLPDILEIERQLVGEQQTRERYSGSLGFGAATYGEKGDS